LRREEPDIGMETAQQELFSFIGKTMQLPPMFSAVHHKGQRLYDLARQGRVVERTEREIEITGIRWLSWAEGEYPRAVFEVDCAHGAYIRTLCHDWGERLGCGAHMSALCRTAAGPFRLEGSLSLADIAERSAAGDYSFILPPGWGLALPRADLPAGRRAAFRRGLSSALADMAPVPDGMCAVYCEGAFLGIGRAEAGDLHPEKVLAGDD
jgi:tRNA pseudouridine55 synthase